MKASGQLHALAALFPPQGKASYETECWADPRVNLAMAVKRKIPSLTPPPQELNISW